MLLTRRQVREAMDRCASAVARFHASGSSERNRDILYAEVQAVAGWTLEMGLVLSEVEDLILRPVEDRLFVRYGHEVAPRLFSGCLRAFEDLYAVASEYSQPCSLPA